MSVSATSTTNYCTFYLADKLFGIPASDVQEIKMNLQYTSIPLTPEYIVGVLNLRGQIVLAIDLAERLSFSKRNAELGNVFVIVKNKLGPFCIITDTIGDVLEISQEAIEHVPESVDEQVKKMICSVCKIDNALLHVLNLDQIANVDFTLPEHV